MTSDYKADFILFPKLLTAQLLTLVSANRSGLAGRKMTQYTERYPGSCS